MKNKLVQEELLFSIIEHTVFKDDGTDFNQTKEERKIIYDRNNARNRDLYGNLKNKTNRFNNQKLLNYDNVINDIEGNQTKLNPDPNAMENAYIDFIEDRELKDMMTEYAEAMKEFNEENESLQQWQQLSQPHQE